MRVLAILACCALQLRRCRASFDMIQMAIEKMLLNNTSIRQFTGLTHLADGYGCWCKFHESYGFGQGRPLDAMDALCKTMQLGYECIAHENTDCVPSDVSYNWGGLDAFMSPKPDLQYQTCIFGNIANACAAKACAVEGLFVKEYTDLFFNYWRENAKIPGPGDLDDPRYRHGDDFDYESNCPPLTTEVYPESQKACCGSYPLKFPYYNTEDDTCCTSQSTSQGELAEETSDLCTAVCKTGCAEGFKCVADNDCETHFRATYTNVFHLAETCTLYHQHLGSVGADCVPCDTNDPHPDCASDKLHIICHNDHTITATVPYRGVANVISLSYGTCDQSSNGVSWQQDLDTYAFTIAINPSLCEITEPDHVTQKFHHILTVGVGETRVEEDFTLKRECEVKDQYVFNYPYGSLDGKEYHIQATGIISLQFDVAAYDESYTSLSLSSPTTGGEAIHLGMTVANNGFPYESKTFAPTRCIVRQAALSLEYVLFDTTCENDIINLHIHYNEETKMWRIDHTLFLLNNIDTDLTDVSQNLQLECTVKICDTGDLASECEQMRETCQNVHSDTLR